MPGHTVPVSRRDSLLDERHASRPIVERMQKAWTPPVRGVWRRDAPRLFSTLQAYRLTTLNIKEDGRRSRAPPGPEPRVLVRAGGADAAHLQLSHRSVDSALAAARSPSHVLSAGCVSRLLHAACMVVVRALLWPEVLKPRLLCNGSRSRSAVPDEPRLGADDVCRDRRAELRARVSPRVAGRAPSTPRTSRRAWSRRG